MNFNGTGLEWNLDRIDQRWGTDGANYLREPEASNVAAYVIDVGVSAHQEVAGHVAYYHFDDDDHIGDPDTACNSYWNGHGTATASILAGQHLGASRAQIVSLRTAACGATGVVASAIVSAVNFIHGSRDTTYASWPAVASMSMWLGAWNPDGQANILDAAVDQMVTQKGVPFFTSANNFSGDACLFSPARRAYTNVNRSWQGHGTVFTAGGTMLTSGTDYRWQDAGIGDSTVDANGTGSNAGDCVSIYAPARNIYVAWPDAGESLTTYATYSGTSFAAPLAAGVAARYIAKYRSTCGVTPSYTTVYNFLLDSATPNSVNAPSTTEYWGCQRNTNSRWHSYLVNPGVCPSDERAHGLATPVHFPTVNNSTWAGILYTGTI